MAFDPRQPFTRPQAKGAGIGWRQLAGPSYQQLLHGIHIAADVVVTPLIRAQAALLAVGGEGALYGVSAAELRELPVPVSEDTHVLIAPDSPRVRRAGVVTHRGTRRLSSHLGIPLTAMVDTFVDVAMDYPLVDAVVLGDAMVREGYARPAELVRAAAARTDRRVGRARRAAALVRPRARLPQETRLRLLMILSGLPEPKIGFKLTAAGRARELDTISRIRTALASAGAPLPPISQEWRLHFPTRRRPPLGR